MKSLRSVANQVDVQLWDTDVHSTSLSDGSTVVPDIPGRCLRRALDQKVRNLRTMLTADEDITTELDRVVCRLMKLALQSSRGRQAPPPTRWMQCKLLDLLTLTEKAIGRRKKRFIESYPVKAIELDMKPLNAEIEQDNRVKEIVDKYRHLIQPLEKMTNTDDTNGQTDVDIEDEFLSTTSKEFLKDDYIEGISPSLVIPQPVFSTEAFQSAEAPPDENPLERTKAWLDEDVEVVPYPKHEMNYENISSGDTDHSVSNARHKHKKSSKKHKSTVNKDIRELDMAPCKTSPSKNSSKFKIQREDKKKNSSTRVTKKVAKKKPSYNSLVKSFGRKYSSAESDKYVVSSKRKNMEHQSFNMTASKPIPETFIELCHPELKAINTTDEANIISNIPSCNISATEDSCLIGIVMQDFDETIALRRTIGTDAEIVPEIIRKDTIETLSNEFDKNLCTKHEVSTENVQSQTIFLNDINEPSTSKGIRHNISTDVQCGPDTLAAYPMLSASTSLVKMPQVFSTGIKIHDVGANTKVKGTDFGTSTQDNNNLTTITPRLRSVGIKIQDSDIYLCSNAECSTMTVAESVPQTSATVTHTPTSRSSAVNSAVSSPETKLIKPIASTLKIGDSGSEFCAPSIASSSKTLSNFMNVSKNTSDVVIESLASKEAMTEKGSPTKFGWPRLSCGGVHVHSYRDKQVSEDIVYQGEWQRYRPKALTRKKTYNVTTLRKVNEAVSRKMKETLKEKKVNSKEKVFRKRQEKKQTEAEPKKPMQVRNVKQQKVRQEDNNDQNKKSLVSNSIVKVSTNTMRIPRPIKTITKEASKIAMSAITSKPTKSTYTVKKPAISPYVNAKKDSDKPQKAKKSYIPLYLKRTSQLSTRSKDKLNKSLDSANDAMKVDADNAANKIAPLVRSKTEEIRKDLLKFSDEVRENISYVVFRNDLQDKTKSPEEQTSENNKDRAKQLEMLKRSLSPQSLNSSTCSSPNSIATVRAVSTRVKNMSNRRHSASSYKSILTNSELDNPTPTKTKKVTKRCKTAKKTENKDNENNKENIPESTKNYVNKDKDDISKSPFVGRAKSVYIAQIKTENSSSPSTLSRHKAQISNVKIPARKEEDEKQRLISPTVSKKRSLKSNTSSVYEDLNQSQTKSYDSSDSVNMVLVLEPQPNFEDYILGSQNISQVSSECATKTDNTMITEWVQNSSFHSHASSIHNSMRQILEETLDLIDCPHGHNIHHVQAKTEILSKDDVQKVHANTETLPGTKTVMNPVETLNRSFLENDIENALNRTFDSVLGDESTVSLNGTRLTVTDLDLLSFKSITSVSKYSEYYLADSEFNDSPVTEHVQTQNTTSVRDIFERKGPHMMQNTPGALAVQAFSGYSLDVEPVAGDQLDPVALIDSETGSLALDINRLATSEELFISGRSSDSYESCLIDEDAVVPNWLFQFISQQQSVEEDQEPVLIGPVAAPLDEPMYDANGNVIEPTIVGAGAGDGRGMHSDHSEDSSGRGTSLSSSDISSGPQSEAIVIDPSAFTAQFELLQDPMASSAVVPVDPGHSLNHTYRIDDDAGTLIGSRGDQTGPINGASDVDADVSSLDTDVPDSSDN